MINIEGTTRINLVQGDDLTYWIGVEKGIEFIDSLEFVCDDLSIDEIMKLTVFNDSNPEKTGYSMVVSHTTTTNYKVGSYRYSVRLTDSSGIVKTIIYEKELNVLPKEATI